MTVEQLERTLPTDTDSWVDAKQMQSLVESTLAHAKDKGATQAEVEIGYSLGLSVEVRLGEVESIEFQRDKSIGLTVYCGQKRGNASTTDLSPRALEATLDAALNIAKFTEEDKYAGLNDSDKMASEIPDIDAYHPWALTVDNAIEMAKKAEAVGLEDKRIKSSDGASVHSSQAYCGYANSHGFFGRYPTSRHSLSCVLIGEEKGTMERDYQYTVSRSADELMPAALLGKEAMERTLARLGGRRLKTMNTPVLFHADVASGLWGSFFSAIAGGALYRKQSFLLDSLDTKVFPEFVTLTQKPHVPRWLGSAPFDQDGLPTIERNIVEAGVVQNYLLSTYSARQLGMESTGNSGGIFNILLNSTGGSHKEMLAQMGTGLLVTSLMGSGVNPTTGDYSRGASGFWVENGEIQYPVHEITIAGNLKDMFQQIVAIGDDVDARHVIRTGSVLIEQMSVAGS